MGVDARDFYASRFSLSAMEEVDSVSMENKEIEEEVSSRVIVVERSSGRLKVVVPANVELTFGVISSKSDRGPRDYDYGRDLRFYEKVGTRKSLIATLTGVVDFFDPGLLHMLKWNPKLERVTHHSEDNATSESSSSSTITGGWEPYIGAADSSEDLPF